MIRQNAHSFYSWQCWAGSVLARLNSVSIHPEFCFLVIVSVVVRPNFDTPNLNEGTTTPMSVVVPYVESGKRQRLAATLVATALLQQRHEQKTTLETTNLVSYLHLVGFLPSLFWFCCNTVRYVREKSIQFVDIFYYLARY
jgi:hypothetical protein